MDIFDFDIFFFVIFVKKLDMGCCVFEIGKIEGEVVIIVGKNSEVSFGGGLNYKE